MGQIKLISPFSISYLRDLTAKLAGQPENKGNLSNEYENIQFNLGLRKSWE